MQVPQPEPEPDLIVTYNIPSVNYSLDILYKDYEDGYINRYLTKLIVDEEIYMNNFYSHSPYNFSEAGEHVVKYYVSGYGDDIIGGMDEYGEFLSPNPLKVANKIIISKKYLPYLKWNGQPNIGTVYFNGTKAEWNEILSELTSYKVSGIKTYINNHVNCSDGSINYD